jgi:hypothetical protein
MIDSANEGGLILMNSGYSLHDLVDFLGACGTSVVCGWDVGSGLSYWAVWGFDDGNSDGDGIL